MVHDARYIYKLYMYTIVHYDEYVCVCAICSCVLVEGRTHPQHYDLIMICWGFVG